MAQPTAVDAISAAMEHTSQQLFAPFRWSQWWRLALLGLATGELSSSGGCNGGNLNSLGNIGGSDKSGGSSQEFLSRMPSFDPAHLRENLLIIGFALLFVGLFLLLVIYVRSICRFILIETVVTKKCSLRQGWRKWRKTGRRYFLWELVYQFAAGIFLVIVIGIPVGIAALAGWFNNPSEHLLPLILGGIVFFFIVVAAVFLAAVIYVLGKDFMAPIMALEHLDFADAWSRLLAMMRAEKGGFAGYIGMKIVLAIAAGIVFGIIGIILFILFLIPVGGIGAAVILGGKAAGLSWNVFTITLAVVAGSIALFILLYLMALISVPMAIFFPAYSLHFFAGRYPALYAWLHPEVALPPAPPVAPPNWSPPQPLGL